MKKKRILHIINSMENGGMQSYLMTIDKSIDHGKYQFDFLVYNDNPLYYEEIRALGGNVYVCPKAKNIVIKYIKRLKYKFMLYHQEKFDFVHVHVGVPDIPYLGIIEKVCGIQNRIYHCHNSYRPLPLVKRVTAKISRIIMAHTYNYFIAVSDQAAKWGFTSNIINTNNYTYVPDGIIVKNFQFNSELRLDTRRKLGIENKIVLGNIGRFTEQKNHMFLVDLIKDLTEIDKRYCLLLVGEGALQKKIEAKINDLKLSNNVIFYGTTKKVNEVLCAMDVFVFPSLHEGLGIVAIEAQANGLTVVSSEHVPNEAKVTSNYIVAPIENGTMPWVKAIEEAIKQGRDSDFDNILKQITKSGYEVSATVGILDKLYQER